MRQIPIEGIYCREYPCRCGCRCFAFPDEEGIPQALAWFSTHDDFKRLCECVDLKPQVLTWMDRDALRAEGAENMRKDLQYVYTDCTLRGQIEKWKVDRESL